VAAEERVSGLGVGQATSLGGLSQGCPSGKAEETNAFGIGDVAAKKAPTYQMLLFLA
jgi:hypothetical protein